MAKGGQSYFLVIYPKSTPKNHLLEQMALDLRYFNGMSILKKYSRYNKTYFHIYFPKKKQKTLNGLTNTLNSLPWQRTYPGKRIIVEIDSTFRRHAKYKRDLTEVEKLRKELKELEIQADALRNKIRELESAEFSTSQKKRKLN